MPPNVDVVRTAFEAWSGGDMDRVTPLLDAAIEWEMAADEPDSRTLHGPREVLEMLGGWVESFEEFSATPREFIEAGEEVVVPIVFVARPRGGEATLTIEETQVFTLRAGTVVRVREYRTKAEALEVVGLGP